MEEEFEFYIITAKNFAQFFENDLHKVESINQLNHKIHAVCVGCNQLDKASLAKLQLAVPEQVLVFKDSFFKENLLSEITKRLQDIALKIKDEIVKVAEDYPAIYSIATDETLSFAEAIHTFNKKNYAKKPSTHNKYKKREYHRRFF